MKASFLDRRYKSLHILPIDVAEYIAKQETWDMCSIVTKKKKKQIWIGSATTVGEKLPFFPLPISAAVNCQQSSFYLY